jgi:NADH-quinone oxidoreductase subunit C
MSLSVEDIRAQFSRMPVQASTPLPPAPPAVSEGATPSDPPGPYQVLDYRVRGYQFEATVPADQVVTAAEVLDHNGFALDAVTGVDWIAQDQMEVIYDFFHPQAGLRVAVRCRVPRSQPEVPTISTVFPGANWHERETHDFFGIRFLGHPDLTPLLLPEDADYHPLRKDFSA